MSTQLSVPTTTEKTHHNGMFVALVPWVLFTVVAEHGTLKAASIITLVVAIAIALPSIRAREPKIIELGGIVAFFAFAIVAFTADGSTAEWLTRYARAVAAGLLAAIALGSLLFVPFTEQYARAELPREYWSSPVFKALNRRLTLLWAGVFAAMVPSHVIAGTLDSTPANIVFNWVIPIGLVLLGLNRTQAMANTKAAA
ncbi:MAG TPA: hypothetical protein VHZ31_09440 [Solirubrobacteraceae bacterium]|jgi:hypothetical protein|nr:hypothetical protein [Solirubrobacteraceae bacterium]